MIYQLFDKKTSSFTYVVSSRSGVAAIIDPVLECLERDAEFLKELNLRLKYIIETHIHADHITGASRLQEIFGKAEIVVPIYSHESIKDYADKLIAGGDALSVGEVSIEAIHTPGHTAESMCYYTSSTLFTGDTVLIRGCGRTDFQNGDPEELFRSIHKLYERYDDAVGIYPGHDYHGRTKSSVGEEKAINKLIKSDTKLKDFLYVVQNLNLSMPKNIDRNIAANLTCGSDAWPDSEVTVTDRVIAIDVDNTVLKSDGPPFYQNVKPLEGAVEAVNTLIAKGSTVDFYTGRHASLYDITYEQLTNAGFQFRALIMGKAAADVYIDDRSIRFTDWEEVMSELEGESTE